MDHNQSLPLEERAVRVNDALKGSNLSVQRSYENAAASKKLWNWMGITNHLSPTEHEDTSGFRRFRRRLGHFLEGHLIQTLGAVLVALDLITVVSELFIEEHWKKCNDADHIPHGVEIAEEVLIATSLVILFVLAFEILLLLVAFGINFFKHPLYVLDLVVISTSILFEFEFRDTVGGLLVIFRLWRIVRIIHSVAIMQEEKAEGKMNKVKSELEEERRKVTALEQEVLRLRPKTEGKEYGSSETTPLLS